MGEIHRLHAALDLLRPRTFFRALARVNRLVEETKLLRAQIDQLSTRIEQLAIIETSYWEHETVKSRVNATLDAESVGAHVRAAVDMAPVEMEPFPHIVVTDWLPKPVYDTVIHAVPPPIFFAGREERRQQMKVPFTLAPVLSQHAWRFLSNHVVSASLCDALNEKFAAIIRGYVRTFCPDLPPAVDLTLHASDGRIMLRRPGYVIEPHRDPKWGFLTGLVYLAGSGDNEAYGTQLYRVRDDVDAPSDKPYYIDSARCELVKSIPFRPNTLFVFLNSKGAHGASIPADAVPPDLIRLVFQFRLGLSEAAMRQILRHMPPEQQTVWAGAKSRRVVASASNSRY